jgi:DNA-binding transcriptional MerR regulator
MADSTCSPAELMKACGIGPRTLRRWTSFGVLPPTEFHGGATRYSREHLLRARVVAHLRAQKVGLAAIRKRLARATVAELEALLPRTATPATAPAVPEPPASPNYPARVWHRIEILPGLEVHVDAQGGEGLRRIAQAIYQHYGVRRP